MPRRCVLSRHRALEQGVSSCLWEELEIYLWNSRPGSKRPICGPMDINDELELINSDPRHLLVYSGYGDTLCVILEGQNVVVQTFTIRDAA